MIQDVEEARLLGKLIAERQVAILTEAAQLLGGVVPAIVRSGIDYGKAICAGPGQDQPFLKQVLT